GRGQRGEAPVGLDGQDRLRRGPRGVAALVLEASLATEADQRGGPDAGHGEAVAGGGQLGEGADPGGGELAGLLAAEPGDAAEVVVVLPLPLAHLAPPADRAVPHRLR